MQESLARIKELHAQGKISDQEYHELIKSVTPNPIFKKLSLRILINPFSYATGGSALIAGALFVLIFSFVASTSFVHFPGTLDIDIIDSRITNLNFWYILFQNLIIILSLTLFFFLATLSAKNSKIHITNLVGALFLSRIPYFVATLLLIILSRFMPQIIFLERQPKISSEFICVLIIIIPCLLWQCGHYFLALKTSSTLKSKWLWIVFIAGVLASEAATLTTYRFLTSPRLKIERIDQDQKSKRAVDFANEWLELVDQKKYSASWEKGSTNFKIALPKSQWVDHIKMKEKYGKMLSRETFSTNNFSKAGQGHFIRIIFKSSYDKQINLTENVTLFYENGHWKLSEYLIM